MKRVKIWKPDLEQQQDGKGIKTVIKKKKGKLLKETSVLDSTFTAHEAGGDARIIHEGRYMEEIPMPKDDELSEEVKALVAANSREELNEKAAALGIEEPEKLDNKADVAQAIVDKENEGEQ